MAEGERRIDETTLSRLLELSGLSPDGVDLPALPRQLDEIVSYFGLLDRFAGDDSPLSEADATGVDALRDDDPAPGLRPDELARMSPQFRDGYFRVTPTSPVSNPTTAPGRPIPLPENGATAGNEKIAPGRPAPLQRNGAPTRNATTSPARPAPLKENGATTANGATTPNILSLGLVALKNALDSGALTSVEIVRAYRAAWEADCRHDKPLNGYVEFFADAENAAREADLARAAGDRRPLLGLPFAVKDNVSVRGRACACGSKILSGYVAPYHATAVARLIDAGAIPLGRANMDEFAMGSSTEYSAYGPSRNPVDRDLTPGGSSGGSAAVVAARQAPVALGSETGGSVRLPASYCGVWGLKPTYGAVSRSGLVAFGSSLDQIGAFARSPEDLALLFSVMAGKDPADATSAGAGYPDGFWNKAKTDGGESGGTARGAHLFDIGAGHAVPPVWPLPGVNLARLRVAVPAEFRDAEGLDPEVAAIWDRTADRLAAAGAKVETVSVPSLAASAASYYVIALSEAASNLSRFDGLRYGFLPEPAADRDFAGYDEFLVATRSGGFGAEVKRRLIVGNYVLSSHFSGDTYKKAMAVRARVERDMAELFGSFDLLLCPSAPTAAFPLGSRVDSPLAMYLSDLFTAFANLARIPALSFPSGKTAKGLPVGMQLAGPRFGEALLLGAAQALENAI